MNQESDNDCGNTRTKRISAEWIQLLKKLVTHGKGASFIVLLTLLGIVGGATLAQVTFQQGVASSGTIVVVGLSLFGDKACTNRVTSIRWGMITPGTSVQKYVYLRSDGTKTATLSMSYGNWTPATAASYFTFTWNCSNYALFRNATVCAKLTLTSWANTTGVTDFNFMIFVQATV